MSQEDVWTIGRLLNWTADYLKDHGSDSPRLDAEVLLAHARGCPRIALYTAFEEDPGDALRAEFRELVRRRADGTPVAYLVGRREFYSLSFRVTPDVLIPRPETEFVVIALLDLAKQRANDALTIADVGTGSGILAVCAAKELPNCRVIAIDASCPALEVARSNAQEHGVEDRMEFVESDLFTSLPPEQRFDFIVSNPPYVATAEMEQVPPDVREHEPLQALEAGEKGTEIIQRLVAQSAERLIPGGYLLCEISPMLEGAVRDLFAADSGWGEPRTIKDLAGLPRVIEVRRPA